jgi:hypothetical protein
MFLLQPWVSGLARKRAKQWLRCSPSRGIPFIFYSGQPLPNDMRERWPLSPLVVKPADPRHLVESVAALLSTSIRFRPK